MEEELPKRLQQIQPWAKFFVPGLVTILALLLFLPQLREPLDFKIRINKDMYLTLWQLGVMLDLILLFPCLIFSGSSKIPFLSKYLKE